MPQDKDYLAGWMSWFDKKKDATPAPSPTPAQASAATGDDRVSKWSAWLDKLPSPVQKPGVTLESLFQRPQSSQGRDRQGQVRTEREDANSGSDIRGAKEVGRGDG